MNDDARTVEERLDEVETILASVLEALRDDAPSLEAQHQAFVDRLRLRRQRSDR